MDSLRNSKLYRADQNSYTLYPDKDLPLFLQKNNILADKVNNSKLLQKLLENNNVDIVSKDVLGQYHFNPAFNNVNGLRNALDQLPSEYESFVEKES